MYQVRQGDVFLEQIDGKLPKSKMKKLSTNLVAEGEFSDHVHVVEGDVELFELNGTLFVAVGSDGATLEHKNLKTGKEADHKPISLPKGTHKVTIQREYNAFTGGYERVWD